MSGLPKVPQLVSGRPGTGSLVPVTPKPVLPTPHTWREEAHSANLTILVRLPLFSPEITLREQRKTGLQGCGSEFSPIISGCPRHRTVPYAPTLSWREQVATPCPGLCRGLCVWWSLTQFPESAQHNMGQELTLTDVRAERPGCTYQLCKNPVRHQTSQSFCFLTC